MEIVQRFNIINYARRSEDGFFAYINKTGVAETFVCTTKKMGVEITRTMVRFNEKDYTLMWVENGFGKGLIMLVVWDGDAEIETSLYTDQKIPAEDAREIERNIISPRTDHFE